MESGSVRFGTIGELRPESMSDTKSGLWQIDNQSVTKDELICPEPRHASSFAFILNGPNKFGFMPKSTLPVVRRDHDLEILDLIMTKDEGEGDLETSNSVGFSCGSPPVRVNNPVVCDPQFVKQTMPVVSALGISSLVRPAVKRGSPSCAMSAGSKPQVRVEDFTCGSPESRYGVVPAVAA